MRKLVAIAAGLIMLAAANYGIWRREQLLVNGRVILLRLAPVDPRSLMQGDYMALRFQVASDMPQPTVAGSLLDGHVVVNVDARGVGTYTRLDQGAQLAADEARLRYRVRGEQIKFATNAFFFEEGSAERYAAAQYGEFRVDAEGESILTGLRDGNLQPL